MNLLSSYEPVFALERSGLRCSSGPTPGILTIPLAQRAAVYQYYDGGLIQFAMPGDSGAHSGRHRGGDFRLLIGLPVLRLKSDYAAIPPPGLCGDHSLHLPVG